MIKINNKEIYIHKNTITKNELYEYISKLYIEDKQEILRVFNKVKDEIQLQFFYMKIETKTKIIDLKNKYILYKLKKPILIEKNEDIFNENIKNELYKYGILDFNAIPSEETISNIRTQDYAEKGILENGKIRINGDNFNKILLLKNNKYKIYNTEYKIFIEENNEKTLIFPIQKEIINTNSIIEIFNLLIEKENGKFYIFNEEIKISENLGNLLFFNVVKINSEEEIVLKDLEKLKKLIESGKIYFEKEFLENKILLEENDKTKIQYSKSNFKDMNLGLWSIYDKRQFSKNKDFIKVYSNKSIYGENPLNSVDKNSQVFIEFDNEIIRVLIKDSVNDRIYPKSVFEKREKQKFENLNIMKFCNIQKFLEDYEKFESRPNTSKNDIIFSDDAFKEYKNCEKKGNFYWIDFKNVFNNDIYIENINKKINLIEILAYNLGLYLNNELDRKIFLRYCLTFSNIRTKEELDFIKFNFEKGIRKSIPTSVLKDIVMEKFKVEYRVENNTSLLASILNEKSTTKIKVEENSINYIVFSFNKNEYSYSIGDYKKLENNERYDLEINKKILKGLKNDEFIGEKTLKLNNKIENIILEKLNIFFLDIENNKNIFFGEINVIINITPELKKFIVDKLYNYFNKIKLDFKIIEILENDKIILNEKIELNQEFFKLYGLLLSQRSGFIKMYKEKIIEEEKFLYKVGIKRNQNFEIFLDNNNENEWVKTLQASEKEICLQYLNEKNEMFNLILELERDYADASIYIKIRGKDSIDYTVINNRGKQLEEIKTEIL